VNLHQRRVKLFPGVSTATDSRGDENMVSRGHFCEKGKKGGLVGGLEHEFYFATYWECHHPN